MLIFKNISEWSKHKVRLVTCLFWLLYFVFATIIPIIIVSVKYSLLKNVEGVSLTLVGWIVVIICATVGVTALIKSIDKLPEYTRGEQLFKAIIMLISKCIIPVLVLVAVHLVRVNMETALNVIMWSSISMIGAGSVKSFLVYPLEVQLDLIKKREERNAIDNVNV